MKITEKDITKIVLIGRRGVCNKEELVFFIPRLPMVHGSEGYLAVGSLVLKKWKEKDMENFVKGLHLIEAAYREAVQHTFGFGSVSPTSKVLAKLKKLDPKLTEKLTDWVAENGGNYYIKSKRSKKSEQFDMFREI